MRSKIDVITEFSFAFAKRSLGCFLQSNVSDSSVDMMRKSFVVVDDSCVDGYIFFLVLLYHHLEFEIGEGSEF